MSHLIGTGYFKTTHVLTNYSSCAYSEPSPVPSNLYLWIMITDCSYHLLFCFEWFSPVCDSYFKTFLKEFESVHNQSVSHDFSHVTPAFIAREITI